jgi:hypothetical protein
MENSTMSSKFSWITTAIRTTRINGSLRRRENKILHSRKSKPLLASHVVLTSITPALTFFCVFFIDVVIRILLSPPAGPAKAKL